MNGKDMLDLAACLEDIGIYANEAKTNIVAGDFWAARACANAIDEELTNARRLLGQPNQEGQNFKRRLIAALRGIALR